MKKMLKRFTLSLLLCIAVFAADLLPAAAMTTLPYDTYNYDYREYIHYTPAAYTPAGNINIAGYEYNGAPVGSLVTPQDLCKDAQGLVYIADTGNNRIVVLDAAMTSVVDIIDNFDNEGTEDTFKKPYGICVSENGQIYIADSQNRRVVVLEKDHSLVKIVANPVSESLDDGFTFTPLKVTVDYADRIYVIAQNMFEGIMVFESDGNFSTFFGTIDVEISAWEIFWKRVSTKEERSKQKLYIPTEFTGLDIDPSGFVYATNIDADGEQGVRRLNPNGQDVIKKGENLNVGGDLQTDGTTDYAGVSQFIDVVYRGSGIYSCLDRKRGRIFTYDHEGNLLYIFGGLGQQVGTFRLPTAIDDIGDKIIVLDATLGEIVTFDITEYGSLINDAVALRYSGDEAEAVELWERVLELDEDNELAHIGIGKAYLTAGDYVQAMKHLKLGMSRDYYSVAFRRWRNDILKANASWVLSILAVLVVGLIVFRSIRKRKKGAKVNG